jgi:hypothetical protein
MNVDWTSRKALAIESDDWGICSWCPDLQTFTEVRQLDVVHDYFDRLGGWVAGGLETPEDMERLFSFLEGYRGRDGRPAVFTPCYAVANPDYDRIIESDLAEYHDIFLDEGVPGRWQHTDILGKAREGMRRGVWLPEFHTRLHHAQPYKWLQAVREGSPQAAALFERQIFQCEERRPEYEDMTPREQADWIVPAIRRMDKLFGRLPRCGINSDAGPETEKIWAAQGLRVRMNRGSVSNAQSADPPQLPVMGTYRADIDMTYLSRNCFLEPLGSGDLNHPSGAIPAAQTAINNWQHRLPTVCSSHRKNFLSYIEQETENGYDQAERFFDKLTSDHPDIYFLTSWEVAQMYRQAASLEFFGDHIIARNWGTDDTQATGQLPAPLRPREAQTMTTGRVLDMDFADGWITVTMQPGDYHIQLH